MSAVSVERHPVVDRLRALHQELDFYREHEDAAEAMILALLTFQHVFLLGPPGTAKSEMVRHITRAITGARHFETSMSRNKPTEKVTGPVDMKRWREEHVYVTQRSGYITDAHFATIEEIGKMSAMIGHDLLALLNERVFHEVVDGKSVHDAPLLTAFTTSNELITDQSDEAAALWDRLAIRVFLDYVKDKDSFLHLLTAPTPGVGVTITLDELREAHEIVKQVNIAGVTEAVWKLRRRLSNEGIDPGDRRFRVSMDMIRAAAFLAGRDHAIDADLAVLRFTLWDTAEQIDKVHHACLAAADPHVEPLAEVRQIITDLDAGISERLAAGSDESARSAYAHEVEQKLGAARTRLDVMLMEASGQPIRGFKVISDLHLQTVRRNLRDMMGQTDDGVVEELLTTRRGDGDGGNS